MDIETVANQMATSKVVMNGASVGIVTSAGSVRQ